MKFLILFFFSFECAFLNAQNLVDISNIIEKEYYKIDSLIKSKKVTKRMVYLHPADKTNKIINEITIYDLQGRIKSRYSASDSSYDKVDWITKDSFIVINYYSKNYGLISVDSSLTNLLSEHDIKSEVHYKIKDSCIINSYEYKNRKLESINENILNCYPNIPLDNIVDSFKLVKTQKANGEIYYEYIKVQSQNKFVIKKVYSSKKYLKEFYFLHENELTDSNFIETKYDNKGRKTLYREFIGSINKFQKTIHYKYKKNGDIIVSEDVINFDGKPDYITHTNQKSQVISSKVIYYFPKLKILEEKYLYKNDFLIRKETYRNNILQFFYSYIYN